ncbi:hypothetical protein ABBQ32_004745 [Trebouxia sp. C0010 RCD-2024]
MGTDEPASPHSSSPQFGSPTFASQPSPTTSSNRHSPQKGVNTNNASPSSRFSYIDQQAHSQDTVRTHESFAAQSSWPHPFGSFEEHGPQQGLPGDSRQGVIDPGSGSALGDVRDWQPPRQELGCFVPPGMDESSYVAGERAALLRAFRETLPSQQALGSLFHAVQHLTKRMDQEGNDVHQVQIALSSLSASLQAAKGQLDALEQMRIPTLEERLQEVSRTSAQDFQTALNAFGETMAASIAHHSSPQGSYLATGFRQVQWLLATFGCYAQRVLSTSDVAVMFLSRKILVDQIGLAAMSRSLPAFYRHPAATAAPQHVPVGYLEGHPDFASRPRSVRAVLGAMLFLAAVESGWQMHHKTVRYLPKNLQAAVSPIQLGLRVMRAAVWTAVLTMSAVKTRHACYSTADLLIHTVLQLRSRYRRARQKPCREGGSASLGNGNSKDANGALSCSVDVAAGGAGLMATSSSEAEQV